MSETSNPFWRFSWDLYHRPGVAGACLALQDDCGLDVNLLLFCLWAGKNGYSLTDLEVASLTTAVEAWQAQVVAPLRGVRRWLKPVLPDLPQEAGALRDAIKDQEIAAEAIAQALLQQGLPLPSGEPQAAVAASNLLRYLDHAGVAPSPQVVTMFARLLESSFPGTPAEQARSLVGSQLR